MIFIGQGQGNTLPLNQDPTSRNYRTVDSEEFDYIID